MPDEGQVGVENRSDESDSHGCLAGFPDWFGQGGLAGGVDTWGGRAEAKKGEEGRALFGAVGCGGLDGDMELSIGENEVVGEGSIGAKADGASIDGDLGAWGGTAIEDEFGVDVHGEGTVVAKSTRG